MDLLVDEECDARKDASALCRFMCVSIDKQLIIMFLTGRPLHGVGFARTRLTVREEAHIHAIESCLDERFDLFENLSLATI